MLPTPENQSLASAAPRSRDQRQAWDRMFFWICLVSAFFSIVVLVFLLTSIGVQGIPQLSPRLLLNNYSSDPDKAGYWPALWGTIFTCALCGMLSLPIGVGTAILLEEYVPKNQLLRVMHMLVRLNIANLAGVPSVVYGILALTAFVNMFGMPKAQPWEIGVRYYDQFMTENGRFLNVPVTGFDAAETKITSETKFLDSKFLPVAVVVAPAAGALPAVAKGTPVIREDAEPGRFAREAWYYLRLPFGKGVLTGGLTLMLVVLPIVIIAAQEALRAVPSALREGALGLGATSWQVVRNVTLPASIPGIMTGSILAMSRAIGEAAPILIISGIVFITNAPKNLMAGFTVMPLQIYNWASYPNKDFHLLAASGIIVLLFILLTFNALAVYIRYRTQRSLS